jgi:hypothetical protein
MREPQTQNLNTTVVTANIIVLETHVYGVKFIITFVVGILYDFSIIWGFHVHVLETLQQLIQLYNMM